APGIHVGQEIPLEGPDEAVSPSGRLKIFGGQKLVAALDGGPPQFHLEGFHAVDLSQPVFSPDGRRFALIFQPDNTGGQAGTSPGVWVFDMPSGHFFQVYPGSRDSAAEDADGPSIEGWMSDARLAVKAAGGQDLAVDVD